MDKIDLNGKSALLNIQECTNANTRQSYETVCRNQGAKNIEQCVAKLTNFCKTNVYTTEDFSMKVKLLQCYSEKNCKGDEQCMKSCAEN